VQVITAPETQPARYTRRVFMAGGITDCPEWQSDLIELLDFEPLTVYNPRQPNFNVRDPEAAPAQVEWEFERLNDATHISFWFPCETLCPITLYELGAWSAAGKPILVGCHPNYARKFDVVKQTGLRRPEVEVVFTLRELADQIAAIPQRTQPIGFEGCGVRAATSERTCRKPKDHDGAHAYA
jgi:Nucleoside 2-deoxyribosyltransferase like